MVNLRFVQAYLEHLLRAKTRHGVHSPFVYRLIDKVIYDFHAKADYESIENIRKGLLQDDRVIEVRDLGAGSHLNRNRQKQVKTIARNASKSPRLAQLIYRLAADASPRNIIELGTCLGITTTYLARAAPDARVITIEGCPQTAAVARETLEKAEAGAELHVGNFDDVLPALLEGLEYIDMVYVDGNHRKDATLNYFAQCLPKLSDRSIMIFDDFYWSKGMQEAWEEIKAHPEVSVTIDLFWIGLVYVRRPQAKEHFRVRF